MPEYLFTGRLTLSGATFFIEAENEEEAKKKAASGNWNDWEIGGAESADWTIYPGSCELNE